MTLDFGLYLHSRSCLRGMPMTLDFGLYLHSREGSNSALSPVVQRNIVLSVNI